MVRLCGVFELLDDIGGGTVRGLKARYQIARSAKHVKFLARRCPDADVTARREEERRGGRKRVRAVEVGTCPVVPLKSDDVAIESVSCEPTSAPLPDAESPSPVASDEVATDESAFVPLP